MNTILDKESDTISVAVWLFPGAETVTLYYPALDHHWAS